MNEERTSSCPTCRGRGVMMGPRKVPSWAKVEPRERTASAAGVVLLAVVMLVATHTGHPDVARALIYPLVLVSFILVWSVISLRVSRA